MADHILKAGDTISGQEGRVYANMDGNIEFLMEVKNLTATVEMQKEDVYTLGHRGAQHKYTGWSGSGSMTLHYVTTRYAAWAAKYNETGVFNPFTITIINNDPASSIGKQTVVLEDVLLDSIDISKLDVENNVLDMDLDFTFDNFSVIDQFSKPTK